MIEFDVRLSSDGVPVVFHDDRTGRTAKENLAVARTPAARLRTVRLKNGERLPFLADVLEIVGGAVPINIESKAPGGIAAAARALSKAGYRGELLLSSGLRGECPRRAGPSPAIPCGLVTGRPSASDLAFCLRHGSPRSTPTVVFSPCCGFGRSQRPASRSCRTRSTTRRRRSRSLPPAPSASSPTAPSPSAGSGAGASLPPISVAEDVLLGGVGPPWLPRRSPR